MKKNEQLQAIVGQYQEAGLKWPATMREVAEWAIKANKWIPHPSAIVSQCAEELSGAMRDEYVRDKQGRKIRTKHAATYQDGPEQTVLWDDIRTASHEHMRRAFQQRRKQILGDCKQLKNDVDSYNENRLPINPIQVVFNFTIDLEDIALARMVA
ncbi:MAG: hypothetical protein Q8L02_02745 [Candidatus Nitrotoga sp.]|nr:hypothetical protein [Candidatus Nitrotoga sp.]